MEDFFDQDKTLAFVYLQKDGDDSNKALISLEKLLVIRKGKRRIFSLDRIARLKPDAKKLLFPLILGGVLAPFAFVSYFANLFHPMIHLVSVLSGIMLFYIGWTGKASLTILLKNGEEISYLLPSISKNLSTFMEYVNSFLKGNPIQRHLYFIIPKGQKQYFFNDKAVTPNGFFPIFGYTIDQIKEIKSLSPTNEILAIDPQKTGVEIKFEYDLSLEAMRPKLDGPVRKNSMIENVTIQPK